jgi:hypothetical protein
MYLPAYIRNYVCIYITRIIWKLSEGARSLKFIRRFLAGTRAEPSIPYELNSIEN